jgi:hypothetical protein
MVPEVLKLNLIQNNFSSGVLNNKIGQQKGQQIIHESGKKNKINTSWRESAQEINFEINFEAQEPFCTIWDFHGLEQNYP